MQVIASMDDDSKDTEAMCAWLGYLKDEGVPLLGTVELLMMFQAAVFDALAELI